MLSQELSNLYEDELRDIGTVNPPSARIPLIRDLLSDIVARRDFILEFEGPCKETRALADLMCLSQQIMKDCIEPSAIQPPHL